LIGALSPARIAESDAEFNLGKASAIVQFTKPGVSITMNGSVFNTDKVRMDRESGSFLFSGD